MERSTLSLKWVGAFQAVGSPLIVRRDRDDMAKGYLRAEVLLPMLRHSRKEAMGNRIEAQLRPQRADLLRRFRFESTAAGGKPSSTRRRCGQGKA